jgi:hypothetical protein
MNTTFQKFLKINKKYPFKDYPNKILIADRARDYTTIMQSLIGIALGKITKTNISVLSSKDKLRSVSIFRSFGINKFIFSINFYLSPLFFYTFFKSILITLITCLKIKIYGFSWLIEKFTIEKIKFGDLIYDSYIRNDKSYLSLNINFKFIKILFISIIKILNTTSLISKYKYKYIIVGSPAYATYAGIAARVGLYKKIKVIEPIYGEKLNYLSYIVYDPSNIKFYNYGQVATIDLHKNFSSYKNILNTKKLNIFLNKRFKGKIKTKFTDVIDILKGNKENFYISRSKLLKNLKLEDAKIEKIVLLAPHLFADYPHGDGKDKFIDYYHALYETVQFLSGLEFMNVLWLVKPHPRSSDLGEQGIVEKVLKKYGNKYLRLCPKINTFNLIQVSDHVVTSTGRIALEFACYGKKPITSGINHISKYNLFETSISKNHFFSQLKNIKKITKLNNTKKILAGNLMHFLDNRNPNITIKPGKLVNLFFSQNKSKVSEIIDPDKIINTKLIGKLKKTNFYNDEYFRDLLKKLKKDKKLFKS